MLPLDLRRLLGYNEFAIDTQCFTACTGLYVVTLETKLVSFHTH
jgi:hypothetical protein